MSRSRKREALSAAKQRLPARQVLTDAISAEIPLSVSMQTAQITTSSGPLPAPEVLAQYDRVYPGLAQIVVNTAAAETAHRRDVEKEAQAIQKLDIKSYRRSELLGQCFGCFIGTFAIAAAVYSGTHGAQITGSFIGTTGVTGLVAAFIAGRWQLNRQREADFQRQLTLTREAEKKQAQTAAADGTSEQGS
jgi:uncharacterized membrane protein